MQYARFTIFMATSERRNLMDFDAYKRMREEWMRKQFDDFFYGQRSEAKHRDQTKVSEPGVPKESDVRFRNNTAEVFHNGEWVKLKAGTFTIDPNDLPYDYPYIKSEPRVTLEGQRTAPINLYCLIGEYQNQFYVYCGNDWVNGWGIAKAQKDFAPMLFNAADCILYVEAFEREGITAVSWVPLSVIMGRNEVTEQINDAVTYAKKHGFTVEDGELKRAKPRKAGW